MPFTFPQRQSRPKRSAPVAAAAVAAAGCNDNTPIRIYDKRPDDYPRSDQKRQFPWENIDAKNEIRIKAVIRLGIEIETERHSQNSRIQQ